MSVPFFDDKINGIPVCATLIIYILLETFCKNRAVPETFSLIPCYLKEV
jgi:hypothetical protein